MNLQADEITFTLLPTGTWQVIDECGRKLYYATLRGACRPFWNRVMASPDWRQFKGRIEAEEKPVLLKEMVANA